MESYLRGGMLSAFFEKISQYTALSDEAKAAWSGILREKKYLKGENFVTEGEVPKIFAFVVACWPSITTVPMATR